MKDTNISTVAMLVNRTTIPNETCLTNNIGSMSRHITKSEVTNEFYICTKSFQLSVVKMR